MRRGLGKRGKSEQKSIVILGNNAAGLANKKDSLNHIVKKLKPGVIMIQDSKLAKKNSIKLDGFDTFELIRKNKNGGGLYTAIHSDFSPVLVSEQSDMEILVVEATLGTHKEIEKTKLTGKMLCLELDANAKVGPEVINGDPNEQSGNGKLLLSLVKDLNLIIVNATEKCSGTITRIRKTKSKKTQKVNIERSVLDYFIVCQKFYELILELKIDEERLHVLTKYASRKGVGKKVETDHNPLICKVDLSWKQVKADKKRNEIIHLKSIEGQQKFYDLTSNTKALSQCFESDKSFQNQATQWEKTLTHLVHNSFPVIRIKKRTKHDELESLLDQKLKIKKELLKENSMENKISLKNQLEAVEKRICTFIATKNKNIIEEHVKEISSFEGEFNAPKMWKLKRKLFPVGGENVMALKDLKGNLVTSKESILQINLKSYTDRLTKNKMVENLKELEVMKDDLWIMRNRIAENNKTIPWTMQNLNKVLKSLTSNKSKDPSGLSNILFKHNIAGDDLKESLLVLFNKMKMLQETPDFFILLMKMS